MFWSLVILGCAAFGLWHGVHATSVALRDGYVWVTYSRASRGHKHFKADGPTLFWVNLAGSVIVGLFGFAGMILEIHQLLILKAK